MLVLLCQYVLLHLCLHFPVHQSCYQGKRIDLFSLSAVRLKNLNFVAGMTRRFVSAKRLVRYFSNSSKLVEHRAQSPVREVHMLAVWPSIAEGFYKA